MGQINNTNFQNYAKEQAENETPVVEKKENDMEV